MENQLYASRLNSITPTPSKGGATSKGGINPKVEATAPPIPSPALPPRVAPPPETEPALPTEPPLAPRVHETITSRTCSHRPTLTSFLSPLAAASRRYLSTFMTEWAFNVLDLDTGD